MSSEFVRYTAEIETIDPHIDEPLAQIIDFAEKRAVIADDRGRRTGRPRRAREVIRPGQGRSRDTGRRAGGVCAGDLRQTWRPRRLDSPLQHVRSPRHGRATRGESHLHHN